MQLRLQLLQLMLLLLHELHQLREVRLGLLLLTRRLLMLEYQV